MIWTAWVEMTTQIHVAIAHHLVAIEPSHNINGTRVQEIVVVPGYLMRMHEYRNIAEIVVVVNDVCQIDHNLMSFIFRNGELGIRVIDGVDCQGEQGITSEELGDPFCIFLS